MTDDPLNNLSERLSGIISETVRFTTTSERLRGGLVGTRNLIQSLKETVESDPELGPEIVAAVEHLDGAADALARAHTFADARLQAGIQRMTS